MSGKRASTPRRLAGTLAGLALAGGLLAGCGSGGGASLAQQACGDVSHSLSLYRSSSHAPPATATRLRQEALVELRRALRPAALAGSAGGQYQALQATLSESSRVPESRLVDALSAQCAATQASAGAS